MFLTSFRNCLRAGLMIGVALALCPASPHLLAQDASAAQTQGRAHIDEVMKGLNRGRSVGQVAVSPDGKSLAWLQPGREGAEIRVAPLDDLTKSTRVTAAAKPEQHCREGQIVWSPDSKSLAFFSDCAKPNEQADLYLAPVDGSAAHRLTELKGYANSPAFSPDGNNIAFLYVEGATRSAGALAAMKPPSGVIGEDGVEIQRVAGVTIPRDWDSKDSATNGSETPSGSRSIKNLISLFDFLTPANLHAYEFDW